MSRRSGLALISAPRQAAAQVKRHRGDRLVRDEQAAAQLAVLSKPVDLRGQRVLGREPVQHQAEPGQHLLADDEFTTRGRR
ncbi:MAG: hypothetical protein MZV65_32990 [Chromatiales bacterium]|nr:hypothetical protein [Chromatiales bacterium]